MSGSHPSRWLIFLVSGALTALGCVGTTDTGSQGETGSLSVDLVLADGLVIDEVSWQITGNGMDMSGDVDVSAPGSTASVEVFGLPPGETDYTVTLTATSNDEKVTCEGSAPFNVEVGQSTDVMVMLNCKKPRTLGGVRVNGKFNICTELTKVVVSPLRTSVGNDISLSAQAFDEEGDAIHYIWSGDGGSIADPSAASTTYTCQDVGDHTVTIMVTDNDVYCRMATWTVPVTCVPGDVIDLCEDVECPPDGNQCTEAACEPSSGECVSSNVDDGTLCEIIGVGDGICSNGQCVEIDLCEGVDCDDDNECTADACNPADGTCENTNVDNGTPCADETGMCVDGACMISDLCEGVVCDDTGNDCTVAMCNTATGICDTMNVTDGTECNSGAGACSAGVCIDDNPCEGVDCTSDNDCVQDGTCDPADGLCDPGDPQPADTACDLTGTDDGFCDGVGTCVGCNDGAQCPDDGNECTAETCTSNACSSSPVADGTACDADGSAGVCMSSVCEDAMLCADAETRCDDGNECTQDLCDPATGECSNPAEPDGSQCTCPVCGAEGVCDMGVCIDPCDGVDCGDDNQCTADLCNVGVCSNPNVGPGAECDQDGGNVCDGAGGCVECISDMQCDVELNETCVGNVCVAGCTVPAPVDAPGIPMACRNSFNQVVSTFPIDLLNVQADDCILDGQTVNFGIDPTIALDTAFLQAAADTLCDLGTTLTSADVTVAQIRIDAVAGATCTSQLAELTPVPQEVQLDVTVTGECGAGGSVRINSGVSLPLPAQTLPCTAGNADDEVQICSTGEVPLAIDLSATPTDTFVGVSVSGGAIEVVFQCNTSSTTVPPPGTVNEIGCAGAFPSTPDGQTCADAVGTGNTGETPFPTSSCLTDEKPSPVCVGGSNAGLPCAVATAATDCPGGTPVCTAGTNDAQACDPNGDIATECPGSDDAECSSCAPPRCLAFGTQDVQCTGTCATVPAAVDPSTVCATFTVQ